MRIDDLLPDLVMEYKKRKTGSTSIGIFPSKATIEVILSGVTRELAIGEMVHNRLYGDTHISGYALLRMYRNGWDVSGNRELRHLAEQLDSRYPHVSLLDIAVDGSLPRELLHPFDQKLLDTVDELRPSVDGRPTPIGKPGNEDKKLKSFFQTIANGQRYVSDAMLYELYENRKWEIPNTPTWDNIRRRAEALVATVNGVSPPVAANSGIVWRPVVVSVGGVSGFSVGMGVAGPGPGSMAAAAGMPAASEAGRGADLDEGVSEGDSGPGAGDRFDDDGVSADADVGAGPVDVVDIAGAGPVGDDYMVLGAGQLSVDADLEAVFVPTDAMGGALRMSAATQQRGAAVVGAWRQTGHLEPWKSEPLRVEEVYAAVERNRALITLPWHIGLPWGDEDLRLVLRWRDVNTLLTESGQQPVSWEEVRVHLPFAGEDVSSWSAGDVALQITEKRATPRPAAGSTATTSSAKGKGKGKSKAAVGKRKAANPAGSAGPARGKRVRTTPSDHLAQLSDPTPAPAPAPTPGDGGAVGGMEAPGPMIAGEYDLFPPSGGPAEEEDQYAQGDGAESLFGPDPDPVSDGENPGGGFGLFPSNSGDEMRADTPTGPATDNNTLDIPDTTGPITDNFPGGFSWEQLFAPEVPGFWPPLGPGPVMGADDPGDPVDPGDSGAVPVVDSTDAVMVTEVEEPAEWFPLSSQYPPAHLITGSQAQHPTNPSLGQDPTGQDPTNPSLGQGPAGQGPTGSLPGQGPVSLGAGDWTRLHPDVTRPDPASRLDESMPATDAGLPRSGQVGDGPAPDPVGDAPWSIDGADAGNMTEDEVRFFLDAWDAVMTTYAQNPPGIDLMDFPMDGPGANADPYLPADIAAMDEGLQESTSLSFHDIFGPSSPSADADSDEANRRESTRKAEPVTAPGGQGAPSSNAVPPAAPRAQTPSPDDTGPALTGRTLTHAHLDRIAQLAPDDLSRLKTLLRINPDGVPARTSHLPDHVLHELFNPHSRGSRS
ncbi:hypothetical protein ACFWBV_35355 [Streptomyces sp. NPDC060030]|uniref:hypothetical protein n=1 Tax=Streptomyces sp. NPDC060030 TaxID=3347042 RepID=UPI0036ADAD13